MINQISEISGFFQKSHLPKYLSSNIQCSVFNSRLAPVSICKARIPQMMHRQREIREIGLIETLAMLLPERVGSPLSINALREDLGVNFMTVQSWLEALERLYFIFKIRPYAGRLARTLRREEKVYLFDFSTIEEPGARFENLVALHLYKLCDAWTDWGFGDFTLYYVRDREKREVDFLITDNQKPYALVEAKLKARDADPNLRYFANRLKPKYVVQCVREPESFNTVYTSKDIILTPAIHFLSII